MKTHCKHGHQLEGENLYISPKGARGCRKCRSKHAHSSHKVSPEKARQYRQTWYRNNPGYDRERHYGITQEEYDKKLAKQRHRCEICGRFMSAPCVDHDHETEQVRDLLCSSCNKAIGFLQDDPLIAQRAVDYLKRWKECPV